MGIDHRRQCLAGLFPGLITKSRDQAKVAEMNSNMQTSSSPPGTWEELWAPNDERDYQTVLSYITSEDTVLEIGAGDLRLAKRMAEIARWTYAIEIQKAIIDKAAHAATLPKNLVVICGDARTTPFPPGITVAILLMRHCTHFDLYVKKLQNTGCRRLITNARWGSGVELIDLHAPRPTFEELEIGWYACLCGAAGFKTGPLERLKAETMSSVAEVRNCPRCEETDHSLPIPDPFKWREDTTLEPIPISPDLPTDIKTLYQEGV
jgi:SAM-dependent methyltransferase